MLTFFRVCYVDPRRQVKLGRALSLKFCIQAAREHMYELHIVIVQYSQGPGPGARAFSREPERRLYDVI